MEDRTREQIVAEMTQTMANGAGVPLSYLTEVAAPMCAPSAVNTCELIDG